VLLGDGHAGRAYELAGDTAFTMAELAAEVARIAGAPVAYRDLPEAAYRDALLGFGLPAPLAGLLADSDRGISAGDLDGDGATLRALIGRPSTTLATAVAAALGRG
jgi:NAD(P)H dehydrogenase (quinone)